MLVESLGNADTAAEFAPLDYWGVTLPPTADENDDGGDNDEEGDADDDDEERRTGGGSSSSGNGGLLAGGSFLVWVLVKRWRNLCALVGTR